MPGRSRLRRSALSSGLAGSLAVATLMVTGGSATAAANGDHTAGQRISGPAARGSMGTTVGSAATPKGLLPNAGQYAFLLRLDAAGTASRFRSVRSSGTKAQAKTAAISQLSTVASVQRTVESQLSGLKGATTVLYRTHAVMAGLAVRTNVRNATALADLPGVRAVYPIAPKTPDNSYAVPFQGAPVAWAGDGSGQNLGEGVTVADIDTGLDYTHKDFDGPGTSAAYEDAHAADTAAPVTGSYDPDKFDAARSYDLVGDDYNADSSNPATYQPVPHPDPNPLDCSPEYGGEGHGTHTAGTIAGYGVTAAGDTYTGGYDATTVNTDQASDWEIGPGMAPQAKLISYRVFGCAGATDVISEAIDRAMDPNGDGDTSDHVDVINLSVGSDFGTPDDGDAVQADLAAKLGVTVSASAGNSYDEYDVAGSPGTAQRAITVAASVDAQSITDGTAVSVVGAPATTYPSQRSLGYDWTAGADLAGTVAAPGSDDPDGCTPFGPTDRNLLSGNVAFLEWNDDQPRCASSVAGANARAAGAIGFVLGSNENSFLPASAITGDAGPDGHPEQAIPGVLMVSDGARAIGGALLAGSTVRVTGTSTASVSDTDATQNDKLASFSSRGIREAGNVKPDVAAVGASVFSALPGAGAGGQDMSGTSMAAPMVSGLAALVRGKHPDWNPEQVKADIMNTADHDVSVGGAGDPGSDTYAPTRVGAGRIDAAAALDNPVLAYVAEDPGAVGVSFGPVAVTDATTLTKHVTVQNTGSADVAYTAGYAAITSVPHVDYQVSPASVTVPAGGTASVTVTLTIPDAETLAQHQSWDPTHAVDGGGPVDPATGAPMDVLAEASGDVVFTPAAGSAPTLRVPAYAAPRPASRMSQPSSLTLDADGAGTMSLGGDDFGYATGTEPLFSLASGFELQATSPTEPACSGDRDTGCLRVPEDAGADLQYVGSTVGTDLGGRRFLYLAVATHGAHSTAAGKVEFDVYFDIDGDGDPDLVAYNTRLGDSDVFIEELVDLDQVDPTTGSSGVVVDQELLPGQNYGLDTAIYDSDVLVVPISLADTLTDPDQNVTGYGLGHYLDGRSTLRYAVSSFTSSGGGQVDQAGWRGSAPGISVDVADPALTVGDDAGAVPFVFDADHNPVTVSRDAGSYVADGGQGLLMVHYQNQVGAKAQVVALNDVLAPTVSLGASSATVPWGTPVALAVGVTGRSGTPTGTVTVTADGTTVASGELGSGGTAALSYTPATPGTVSLQATYDPADGAPYGSATSASVPLTVTSVTGAVTVTSGPAVRGLPATLTVAVSHGPGGPVPTGMVQVRVAGASVGSAALGPNGSATISYPPAVPGSFTVVADYAGDARYAAGSGTTVLKVAKAAAAVSLKVTKKAKKKLKRGKKTKVTVRVATVGGIVATGPVTVTAGKRTVGSAHLHGGRAKVKVKAPRAGKVRLHAVYRGDWTYLPGRS